MLLDVAVAVHLLVLPSIDITVVGKIVTIHQDEFYSAPIIIYSIYIYILSVLAQLTWIFLYFVNGI